MDACMNTPVFLLCSERCGSNLICGLLNAHSKVYAPLPLHLGLDFWDTIYRYGPLARPENWRTLVEHVVATVAKKPGSLLSLEVDEVLANVEPGAFENLFVYIYEKGMRAAGKQQLFLKDNHLHRQLFYILRVWPDARFVLQVRDPRDYLLSCKRVSDRYVHYGSSRHAIEVWREDQERALEAFYALPPGQVFVQTYEDLVENPTRVLGKLCEFLGFEFEPTMLDFHESEAAKIAAKAMPNYWGNLDKPLLRDNSGKYRSGLSTVEIREVEERVGELMQRFGYALDFPNPNRLVKLGLSLRRLGLAPLDKLHQTVYDVGRSRWAPVALKREQQQALTRLDASVRYPYR
jgi:hypothetical protein